MQPGMTFVDPAMPGGGGKAPRPRDLEGCLVAYVPRQFTAAGAPGNTDGYKKSEPRDRVTADLYVLTNPVDLATGQARRILFGGYPEVDADPVAHDRMVSAPAKFTGVWVQNSNIVVALAPNGKPIQDGVVVGRVERSTVGNRPFNLVKISGTPEMNVAIDIWNRLSAGALAYNAPTDLQGNPLPDESQSAGPAAQVVYPHQAAATPPAAPAPPAPPAPPVTVPLPPPPPAPPAPPVAAPMPPALTQAGWTQANWDSLTPTQQAAVLAQLAGTPAVPSTPNPY